MDLNILLIIGSVIILFCTFLNKISNKIGIPTLIFFLCLGIFFTHPHGLNIKFQNYILTEHIASICLLFIMFYGGFGTRWEKAKVVSKPAIVLSTAGVVLTAVLIMIFCKFVLGFGTLESFLMGSVISSTDAASVFSIIRSRKLSLRYNTSSLLELESGSNDPASYLLTIIAIGILNGTMSKEEVGISVLTQVVFAIITGYLTFKVCKFILKKFNVGEGFDTLLIFSVSVFTYAFTSHINGNGYLAVYILGILLGNSNIKNKVTLVHFFDAFTNLMQIALFFSLGFLSNPTLIADNMGKAVTIFLFLTFIARPVAVEILMRMFKLKTGQKFVLSLAGLRGAASIVFAIMANNAIAGTIDLDVFHITFGIVLLSILIQGTLLPFLSKKINMTDPLEDPLKTFNDYSREKPVEFITFTVTHNHNWKNKKLMDIDLSDDLLVVLINRDGKNILPNGNTVIQALDKLVCIAKSFTNGTDVNIKEMEIDENFPGVNKMLKEIKKDLLVILIHRGYNYIIPRGNEKLLINDKIIYLDKEEFEI